MISINTLRLKRMIFVKINPCTWLADKSHVASRFINRIPINVNKSVRETKANLISIKESNIETNI